MSRATNLGILGIRALESLNMKSMKGCTKVHEEGN